MIVKILTALKIRLFKIHHGMLFLLLLNLEMKNNLILIDKRLMRLIRMKPIMLTGLKKKNMIYERKL